MSFPVFGTEPVAVPFRPVEDGVSDSLPVPVFSPCGAVSVPVGTPVLDPDGFVPLLKVEVCEAPDKEPDGLPLGPGVPLVSPGTEPVALLIP